MIRNKEGRIRSSAIALGVTGVGAIITQILDLIHQLPANVQSSKWVMLIVTLLNLVLMIFNKPKEVK